MQREMVEALSFPRLLVLKSIDVQDCPHDSLFDASSERCLECDLNKECHWVRWLNELPDLASQPDYLLNASLRYGVRLVESYHERLRHDESTCSCGACRWIRGAQRLIEEFELRLPPNPYRPLH